MAALPTASPFEVALLAEALETVGATDEQRHEVSAAIMTALPTAEVNDAVRLAEVLVTLASTDEQHLQAIAAVEEAVGTADMWPNEVCASLVRRHSSIEQWLNRLNNESARTGGAVDPEFD
ncbi:MAG: hypothetical protein JW722_08445, partial [Demequinaceae bacterium]|nr:hypothetical protein [Demequinaceae bacterium]